MMIFITNIVLYITSYRRDAWSLDLHVGIKVDAKVQRRSPTMNDLSPEFWADSGDAFAVCKFQAIRQSINLFRF